MSTDFTKVIVKHQSCTFCTEKIRPNCMSAKKIFCTDKGAFRAKIKHSATCANLKILGYIRYVHGAARVGGADGSARAGSGQAHSANTHCHSTAAHCTAPHMYTHTHRLSRLINLTQLVYHHDGVIEIFLLLICKAFFACYYVVK